MSLRLQVGTVALVQSREALSIGRPAKSLPTGTITMAEGAPVIVVPTKSLKCPRCLVELRPFSVVVGSEVIPALVRAVCDGCKSEWEYAQWDSDLHWQKATLPVESD